MTTTSTPAATRARTVPSNLLTALPLRFKITIPYLVLTVALALVATYLVSLSFAQTLQKQFEQQLVDSANRANETLFEQLGDQLTNVRTIAHTQGLAEALLSGDTTTLEEQLHALAVNNKIPLLEILDTDGRTLFQHHLDLNSLMVRADAAGEFDQLPFVQSVAQGQVDELGDKYVGWTQMPWGLSLYTAGPISDPDTNNMIAIVLVGIRAQDLVLELNQAALARVALYQPDGHMAFGTLFRDVSAAPPLSDAILTEVRTGAGNALPPRTLEVDGESYLEAVVPVLLRGQDSGWRFSVALSQALVSQAQGPNLQLMLLVFTLAALAIIGLGVIVAQIVASPVFRLVTATGEVASGKLNVQVPVTTRDEIGLLTERFNFMVGQLQQREHMRDLFGRMVSEEVRESVLKGKVALGGEVRTVSVLFADIRGFTTFSERLTPTEVVTFLNAFFSYVTGVVYEYGGFVNRFPGDAALAVFGAPVSLSAQESAQRAVQAALAMRRRLLEFNAQRAASELAPVRIGIGVNTGNVVTGNIGSEHRFEYTVIGDTVNTTERVSALNKEHPRHVLLITESTRDSLPAPEAYDLVDLGAIQVRGRQDTVHVLAVQGEAAPGSAAVEWAARRGLNYRDVLDGLYLHLKGYPDDAIDRLLGVSPEALLGTLGRLPSAAVQIARHLTMAEYSLPGQAADRLVEEAQLHAAAGRRTRSKSRASEGRRHRAVREAAHSPTSPAPRRRRSIRSRPDLVSPS